MIHINWEELKPLLDGQQVRARFITKTDGYEIHAADQSIIYCCRLSNDTDGLADLSEFESGYKSDIELTKSGSVITATEQDFIVLKLSKIKGQADSNGDLVLELKVPGSVAKIERYVAGGYAYTDTYSYEDELNKVEVVDKDNVAGYGAEAVLKAYHDQELPTENQGWFFEKSYGLEGNVDIEPMGFYGQLVGELYLRMTFKVQPNAKVKCLIWWGKKEQ